MNKINYPDKSPGDKFFSAEVNEIKNVVNNNADEASSVIASTTPPQNPADNDLWFNTPTGKLKIYYNDGTNSQWIDASPNI